MNCLVTPTKFSDLYNRFQLSYTSEGPVVVSYYRENSLIHVYMMFSNVLWLTRIEAELASKYLSMFVQPVELSDRPQI